MNALTKWRITSVALALACAVLSAFLLYPQSRGFHVPLRMHLGADWEKMTPGEKYDFVYAYLLGHASGYHEACLFVQTSLREDPLAENSLAFRCKLSQPKWQSTADSYVVKLADFYRKTPDNLKFQVVSLLDEMAAKDNK